MRYANDPEIERQIAEFGRNMRTVRRRAGMTQTELAAVDGLDRAAISLTEKGKRSPDMRTLLRIAYGLDVTPAELVRGIGFSSGNGPAPSVRGPADDDLQGEPFSGNLHAARRSAGLSQQALGAQSDVDAAAISLYERGQRQPNLRTIFKLARTLRIGAADLLRDVG